jgi:hypothetical protein
MSLARFSMRLTIVTALSLTFVCGCSQTAAKAPATQQTSAKEKVPLKDQMRDLPAATPEKPYVKEYLLCGPFVETETLSAKDGDFLTDAGGEAAIRPTEGQTVGEATWKKVASTSGVFDFAKEMADVTGKKAVAYAFVTVKVDKLADSVVYLRSGCDVKLYCNGKLVPGTENVKGAGKSGLLLPIKLVAGDNALLVRLDGTSGKWNYSMYVQPKWQLGLETRALTPAAKTKAPGFELLTDASIWADGSPVTIDVLGPGGDVVRTLQSTRGAKVMVEASGWPDGPYEIRVTGKNTDGSTAIGYEPWCKGAWMKQIEAIMDEYDKTQKNSSDPIEMRKVLLGERVLGVFGRDPRTPVPADSTAKKPQMAELFGAMMEFRELVAEPNDAWNGKGGMVRLAWRDDVDDSAQFAMAFVPKDYDKSKRYPLFVYLHGYNSANPTYSLSGDQNTRHKALADKYNIIWLQPFGRGNTGYQGIGERDVMRAVYETTRRLSVNVDRIYLTGQSMGGGGTWYVGERHVNVFAAIAPIYGSWDWHANMKEDEAAKMVPLRRAIREQSGTLSQAENLLDTPIFVHHGDADTTVPVEGSRYAVKTLQRWGYNVRYQEHPGEGHANGLFADEDIIKWAMRYSLVREPKEVRLRAPMLYGATSRWVTVDQMENPFVCAYVDATIADPCTIVVQSENALQIRLTPSVNLIPADRKDVKVIWNGELIEKPLLAKSGSIVLRAPGFVPNATQKRPIGPTPFAIVVGTAATDERMKKFIDLAAQQARASWMTWQHTEPRSFKDTEIADAQMAQYSLYLIGGPDENLVTRKLTKGIPLQMTPESITIAGREFKATDAAVVMKYRHPLNPNRTVQIVAGNSPTGFYMANRLPDVDESSLDFAIGDGRAVVDDDDRGAIAWGRFDHNWQYDSRYTNFGDDALRAKAAVRKAPTVMSAVSDAKTLMLSDVLETTSTGSFGMMGRGLNWKGQPIKAGGREYKSGIAVMTWDEPCRATYNIDGAGWTKLKGVLGVELEKKPSEFEMIERADTLNQFVVLGDGKELYRSPMLKWDAKAVDLDVDVTGVKTLELQVTKGGRWHNQASSVNWADLRLEK